jgi:hypothetical protein
MRSANFDGRNIRPMATRRLIVLVGVGLLALSVVMMWREIGVWAVAGAVVIAAILGLGAVLERRAARPSPPPFECSFCGKGHTQVKKLIAGPGVHICDECIDLCNEIIEDDPAVTGWPTANPGNGARVTCCIPYGLDSCPSTHVEGRGGFVVTRRSPRP